MKIEFYLLNDSFKYQADLTLNELEKKISALFEDYNVIKAHDDHIFKHDSIYDEMIYPDVPLWEFLYSGKNILNRDIKKFLLKIIDHSESTQRTLEDIVESLEQHTQDHISGLLCLHEIQAIDTQYLVYNQHNWFDFHRYFLGLYPISNQHFYDECQKYFPQLFFHEHVLETLKTLEKGLEGFSISIVHLLSLLNDKFHENAIQSKHLPTTLQNFASTYQIVVSLQGDAKQKPKMTYDFMNDANIKESVCCEPHIKFAQADDKGDQHYYYNRIHFHEGKNHIANGSILIGHIGSHINF